MNERDVIEAGIVALLQALVADKTLRKVLAIGGNPPAKVVQAALATRSWAFIKYDGKTGATEGELSKQRAEVDVLVGIGNDQSLRARQLGCHTVLQAVENALLFQVIAEGFSPLEFRAEDFVEVTDGGVEIWQSRWAVEFQKGAY